MFRTSCLEKAVICNEHAARLRAGKVWPDKVQKYKKKWSVPERVFNTRVANGHLIHEPAEIEWSNASAFEREKGVEVAMADAERESVFMRDHEKFLFVLAKRVHGQPLLPVVKAPTLEVGDTVSIAAWGLKKARVEALRTIPQGRNGQPVRQARFIRAKDSKTFWVPLRSIRSFTKRD